MLPVSLEIIARSLRSARFATTHFKPAGTLISLTALAILAYTLLRTPNSIAIMSAIPPKVRVGVGAFVLESSHEPAKNPRFLIGQRINAHGAGTWALPGGHLEFGETPEGCAARELEEETGLRVKNVRFLTATNDIMTADNKHYVTMFMVCEREDDSQKAEILEVDKCAAWEWVSWDDLMKWVNIVKEAGEGESLERKLFVPFLSLVDQRPGLLPTMA
ncbi:hypothetical protein EG329_009101 [Mollisiaceae sp. DMI_Dod_QoI]|nr:hypothetical protein EG329_009101 [Helotiales sp. DMI_Dod_QoI]